jgi:hypothetical protein
MLIEQADFAPDPFGFFQESQMQVPERQFGAEKAMAPLTLNQRREVADQWNEPPTANSDHSCSFHRIFSKTEERRGAAFTFVPLHLNVR